MGGLSVMLSHLLYYIWGTPTPSPLLHPPRFTNGHDVMKHLPKLFTHLHHRLLSLDHLSLCHSSLLGIVRMHWCTQLHLRALQFTQVQLRASHPPNSCSESSEWVRLEQGFCLSSLEQVCPFYLSSPLWWLHVITTAHPLHDLVVSAENEIFRLKWLVGNRSGVTNVWWEIVQVWRIF